ncbi:hypothetical protein [Burkholderia glumae]|uniref:hypothetical protein n=1 Tax=Burkholderia glumae TaxID=337 RepID=UPI001C3D5EF7|nr:hypothetical protein [Burkholderia glumae]
MIAQMVGQIRIFIRSQQIRWMSFRSYVSCLPGVVGEQKHLRAGGIWPQRHGIADAMGRMRLSKSKASGLSATRSSFSDTSDVALYRKVADLLNCPKRFVGIPRCALIRPHCHPSPVIGFGMIFFEGLYRGIRLRAGHLDQHVEQSVATVLRIISERRRIGALPSSIDIILSPDVAVHQNIQPLQVASVAICSNARTRAVSIAE